VTSLARVREASLACWLRTVSKLRLGLGWEGVGQMWLKPRFPPSQSAIPHARDVLAVGVPNRNSHAAPTGLTDASKLKYCVVCMYLNSDPDPRASIRRHGANTNSSSPPTCAAPLAESLIQLNAAVGFGCWLAARRGDAEGEAEFGTVADEDGDETGLCKSERVVAESLDGCVGSAHEGGGGRRTVPCRVSPWTL
jgi:hypothetical protein